MSKKGVKKANRNKRKKILFLVFFMVFTLSLLAGLSLTVFFPVKNVVIKGNLRYDYQTIADAANIDGSDNLLRISERTVFHNIQSKLPYVQKVTIDRQLPDTVVITVAETNDFYCFYINGSYYTTDSSLRILSTLTAKPESLLTFVDVKCSHKDSKIVFEDNLNYETFTQLISLAEQNEMYLNEIVFSDNTVDLVVDSRFSVELGERYDLSGKIAHLKGMIKAIASEKQGSIDLSAWSGEKPNGYFVEDIPVE